MAPPPAGAGCTGDGDDAPTLEQVLEEKVSAQRALVKRLRGTYGDAVIGTCSVNQAYGGMRGATVMTYETSDVDPYNGVRIRDRPLVDVYRILPRPPGAQHPYAEGMLWLLLTGDIPRASQVAALRERLAARSAVPDGVFRVLDAFPKEAHPMTQLSAALLAMQPQSEQAMSYASGAAMVAARDDALWRRCLTDVLTVIAQQTVVAAYIYRKRKGTLEKTDGGSCGRDLRLDAYMPRLDLAASFARMMGFDDVVTDDLFRMHLCTHMDHGGGSASCLGVRVVGSTLADAFRAWSSAVNGLAGPRHGLANEEVMRFLFRLRDFLDARPASPALLHEFCQSTLRAGAVIPGYGHTTLLATDPRFHMQRAFAKKHMADDELCALVSALFGVVPDILKEQGKIRSPWPNVDAHSGVLLYNRGLTDIQFHTIMFATSRVMGPLANLVWDRALNLAIVRPMSVTTRWVKAHLEGDDDYISPGLP